MILVVFSALRVYAMWNCNIVLSAVVFLLDVYPVAGTIVRPPLSYHLVLADYRIIDFRLGRVCVLQHRVRHLPYSGPFL